MSGYLKSLVAYSPELLSGVGGAIYGYCNSDKIIANFTQVLSIDSAYSPYVPVVSSLGAIAISHLAKNYALPQVVSFVKKNVIPYSPEIVGGLVGYCINSGQGTEKVLEISLMPPCAQIGSAVAGVFAGKLVKDVGVSAYDSLSSAYNSLSSAYTSASDITERAIEHIYTYTPPLAGAALGFLGARFFNRPISSQMLMIPTGLMVGNSAKRIYRFPKTLDGSISAILTVVPNVLVDAAFGIDKSIRFCVAIAELPTNVRNIWNKVSDFTKSLGTVTPYQETLTGVFNNSLYRGAIVGIVYNPSHYITAPLQGALASYGIEKTYEYTAKKLKELTSFGTIENACLLAGGGVALYYFTPDSIHQGIDTRLLRYASNILPADITSKALEIVEKIDLGYSTVTNIVKNYAVRFLQKYPVPSAASLATKYATATLLLGAAVQSTGVIARRINSVTPTAIKNICTAALTGYLLHELNSYLKGIPSPVSNMFSFLKEEFFALNELSPTKISSFISTPEISTDPRIETAVAGIFGVPEIKTVLTALATMGSVATAGYLFFKGRAAFSSCFYPMTTPAQTLSQSNNTQPAAVDSTSNVDSRGVLTASPDAFTPPSLSSVESSPVQEAVFNSSAAVLNPSSHQTSPSEGGGPQPSPSPVQSSAPGVVVVSPLLNPSTATNPSTALHPEVFTDNDEKQEDPPLVNRSSSHDPSIQSTKSEPFENVEKVSALESSYLFLKSIGNALSQFFIGLKNWILSWFETRESFEVN